MASFLHWSVSFDLPQHGRDLAVATGQDLTMTADEVQLLWGSLTGDPGNWEWQRANGWYAAPVPVPEDAALLERAGLVVRSQRAQFRPCTLDPTPLQQVSTWAERYRPVWEARLDRMDDYLRQLRPQRQTGRTT